MKRVRVAVPDGKPGQVLHIQAGSADWQPDTEDMANLTEIFLAAFNDPKGAVVVTRADVTVTLLDALEGTATVLPASDFLQVVPGKDADGI